MRHLTTTTLALLLLASAGEVSAQAQPAADKSAQERAALQAARDKALQEVAKDPKNLPQWKRLANLQRQLGDEKGTEDALAGALALDPKDAGVHFMLGLLYEKREEWARASAAFRACLENAGKDPIKDICAKHLRRTEKP